jgi:alpha-beta hydrolase superfamily lysophospholipase
MFFLEEITTEDGLMHQGLVAHPVGKRKTAILWVHGLTGTFYGNSKLLKIFAQELTKEGIAFGTFNTRGHDMIAGFRKIDPHNPKGYTYRTIGAGYEVFEECVFDLDAAVSFFWKMGYTNIILAGHSSGANKVSYYAGIKTPSLLSGVILLCPMSDRLDPKADKKQIQKNLSICFALQEQGKENALITDMHFFPMTAKRYISLVSPHTSEDQFGYGDTPPCMPEYSRIRIPMLVLFAGKDEYADRPIEEIQKVFDREKKTLIYHSEIIPDSLHNLTGYEEQVLSCVLSWVKKIL